MHRRPDGSVHGRPDDDSGADVPLLRHGALHDLLHDARRDALPDAVFLGQGLARLHQSGAHHLLQRCADDVHRHVQPSGLQKDRFFLYAHRHHGRFRLPAGADAPGCPAGRDAHDRHRQRLRPDRIRPRQHHERLRRPARSAVQHGRLRFPAHRVQDHRPRDRRGSAGRRQRRVLLARLQHHERLLQDARGHGRHR